VHARVCVDVTSQIDEVKVYQLLSRLRFETGREEQAETDLKTARELQVRVAT
jgi:hypothetical protein